MIVPYVTDAIQIYGDDYAQLITAARPIKVSVRPEATIPQHPLETGASVSDHIIYKPIEIELSLVLTGSQYADLYQTIYAMWKSGNTYTVQTHVATYSNMCIYKIAHEESAEMMGAVALSMSLTEIMFSTPNVGKLPATAVKSSKHTSTSERGKQNATTPTATGSALSKIVDGVKSKLPSAISKLVP